MSTRLPKQALVVGAGIAGLAAARVLADFFDHVIILENDLVSRQAALPTPELTQRIQAAIAGTETPVTRATPCPN